MNFLITGISSYIARYITRQFLKDGDHVTGVSRSDPQIDHRNFEWIQTDLSRQLPDINRNIDYLIHMAAVARLDKPASTYFNANLLLTDNIRRLVLQVRPTLTFYTSSMKIYGQIKTEVVDETAPILNPDLYGMSKYFGEKLLEEAGPTVSIRMPNTIARGSYGWIDGIYKSLIKHEPIRLVSSPYNHTLHPLDIYQFFNAYIRNGEIKSDQFNICASGKAMSLEIVQRMKTALDSQSDITWKESSGFHILSNKKICEVFIPMSVEETIDLYLKEMQN